MGRWNLEAYGFYNTLSGVTINQAEGVKKVTRMEGDSC